MNTRSKLRVESSNPNTSIILPLCLILMLRNDPRQLIKDALNSEAWTKAMEEEMSALFRNNTWTLVPHSPNYNLMGCK